MNTSIGKRIRLLRENKGYSQEIMADKLNMSRSAYGRIETGETNAWASHLEDICKQLEVEPEELFRTPENLNQTNTDNASAVQNYTNKDTHITINQLSEKLIELYEQKIEDLKNDKAELRKENQLLKESIKDLEEELKKWKG